MPEPFLGLAGPILTSSYVELSESAYDAGFEQALHSHDPAYFTAVLAGGYDEVTDYTTRNVSPGALLFHPAGERHAVRFIGRRTHVFRIRPLAPMLEAARLAGAQFAATLERTSDAHDLVARMRAAYGSGDAIAGLTMDALACELVAACAAARARRSDRRHPGAVRAREVIEAQLSRTPSLERLAEAGGCHPITLARAFRRTFGCSVGSYVRRRRLEEAARMLRTTDLPISTIAARCGFADQAHLTRAVRRASGRTPRALRRFKTD